MVTSGVTSGQFDTIVIGVGGMGSATCRELARRGQSVLGLDQFPLVHDRGSSHGESRIIRKAYFEHPDYVPLLHRAYELWRELELKTRRPLMRMTGLILSGLCSSETIRGARLSSQQHGLELHSFGAKEARVRFPGLEFPDDHVIDFEPGAGVLNVEACVQACVDEAVRHGATLRANEAVTRWVSDGQLVTVTTSVGEYRARKLIITAGAWAGSWLNDLNLDLKVVRKFVGWFPTRTSHYLADRGMPTYFLELPHGCFYGFPSFDGATVKIAEHSGGSPVSNPLAVDRSCQSNDLEGLKSFIESCLPGVQSQLVRDSVCLYTMSPDSHFLIDLHPTYQNVAFAAGFSGHGFKFCPVIAEALADLTERGSTKLPIGFLSRSRLLKR